MTPFDLLLTLGVKTLILSLAALVAYLVLRLTRCRSPKIHRPTWAAVLLLGVLGAGVPLHLPVVENRPVVDERSSNTTALIFHTEAQRHEEENRPDFPLLSASVPLCETKTEFLATITEPVIAQPEPLPPLPMFPALPMESTPIVAETITAMIALPETIAPSRFDTTFYATLACTAWCVGIVVILCRRLAAFLMLMRALRSATPAEGFFATEWQRLLAEYKIPPERLPLLLTDQIGPGLVWRRQGAVVLAPRDLWDEATPEMRDGILRHELEHYRNRDLLRSGVSQLLAVVHWFNPVSWFVLRKLDEAIEWLCDIAAFGATDNGRHLFAESLVAVHETHASISLGRYGFGSGSLERRISQLQSSLDNQGDSKMKKASIVFVLALFITAGLFQVRFVPVATPVAAEENVTESQTIVPEKNQADEETDAPDQAPVLRHGIVLDEDGQPAVGAIFRILGDTVEEDFEAVTDENGRFSLTHPLPPNFNFGWFATNADRTRMVAQRYGWEINANNEMVFRLQEGVRVITGTVVDAAGKPVEGVLVAGSFRTVHSEIVRTDKDGSFQFLCPKDKPLMQLIAFKKGVGMDILATEELDPFRMDGGTAVTPPEKISDDPFRLQLAPIEPVMLRIADEDGQPLAEAIVAPWLIQKPPTLPKPDMVMWGSPYAVEREGNNFNTSGFMHNSFMTKTDENGMATIDSVPKAFLDETAFSIQGPLYGVETPNGTKCFYGNARPQWSSMEIKDGVRTVVLPRQATVRGIVKLEDGTPVPGTLVRTIGGGSGRQEITNENGEFLIQDNAHMIYNLSFDSDAGAASSIFNLSVGDGSEEKLLDIVLKPGIRLHGAVFMPDGTPAEGYRIDLREQDPNPPAGWRDNWETYGEHRGTKYMHDYSPRDVRHFGPDGTYSALLPAAPAEYEFVVDKYLNIEKGPEKLHVYVRNIRLLGTETEFKLDFYLDDTGEGGCTPAATIPATPTDETAKPVAREDQTPWVPASDVPMSDNPMIKVLDADGNPMEGVTIDVRFNGDENGNFSVKTDENGIASVKELETKQGTLFVNYIIRQSGYVFRLADWQRESGFPKEHVFTMEKGVEVGGIVVDENNKPIQGATVECKYEAPERRMYYDAGTATTDVEGRWCVDMAPASIRKLRLDVRHPDYMPSELTGTFPPYVQMRDKTSVVMLRKGTSVSGIVLDPDGNPVQDAKVVVTQKGHEFSGQQPQRTKEDGTFRFDNWNPGPTMVYVAAVGFAPQTQEWSDPAETVEFRLEPGKTMKVKVLDMDDNPIPQARVCPFRWRGTFLLLGDRDLIPQHADDEGNWSWTWAPDDEVDISIICAGYMSIRELLLKPQDEPHVFRMRLPLEIRGQVTDAETGEVIRNITMITGGNFRGTDPKVASYWNEDNPSRFTDGNYRVLISEPRNGGGHHFKITADGYEPFVSEMFTDDQGSLQFDVKLTRKRQE